jgi:lipopolysaccharide/colanic/teichoic acid biosynthesis glycosyltransferase
MYAQMRIGYHGRKVVLWKFRTMRHDAEREGPFIEISGGRDLRVTPLGGLPRRVVSTRCALWNVLRATCRPITPEWIKEVEIRGRSDLQPAALVPPGLTGWAGIRRDQHRPHPSRSTITISIT